MSLFSQGQTGAKIQLYRDDMHSEDYAFDVKPPLTYNTEHHGYHCKANPSNPSVKDCPIKKQSTRK